MIKYMKLIGIKARKASEYKVTTEVKNKLLFKNPVLILDNPTNSLLNLMQ